MSEKSDVTMEMTDTPEAKYLNPDEQRKPDEKEPNSALNYLCSLLSDSVVTGVPQIITVGHIFRKIFKTVILTACIAGFIYQAVEFMNLYYTYPSTIDIDIEYAKTLPAPKLTICNANSLLRSRFCAEKPDYCEKPTELSKFCNKYSRFCNETTDIEDLKFIISETLANNPDYLLEYGQDPNILIEDCCNALKKITDQCRNSTIALTYSNFFNVDRACYTIDFGKFQVNESDAEKLDIESFSRFDKCYWWTPYVADKMYTVALDLQPFEYIRPEINPAAQIAVHSSNTEQNPFLKGFHAKAGKRYTVKLQANEEYLLPKPFSTNCIENSELGHDYSRDECLSACALTITLKVCDCAPLGNSLRDNTKLCIDLDEEKQKCATDIDLSSCYDVCPKPCHSFYFDYDVSESDLQSGIPTVDLGGGPVSVDDSRNISENDLSFIAASELLKWNDVVVINILYSKPEIKTYRYTPKYEKVEILGYIGGYSGIWLGISLVAVFDFLETIVVFCCFLCRRSKKKAFK